MLTLFESDERLGTLFVFIAETGCRLGEALGLRWQDVKWDRVDRYGRPSPEIEFTQTVGRLNGRDVFGPMKTEASQAAIPMTGYVRSVLLAQKARQDDGLTGKPPMLLNEKGVARGPLVWTAIDGGPLNGSYVTHRFQSLLVAAGLPKLRVHDLRHLYVSMGTAKGVPVEAMSTLVRHASPTVTRQIYLHLRPDVKRDAAERIASRRVYAETGS